jgi:HK97 family phage major capsid protein/HK97 family phage prohead protease
VLHQHKHTKFVEYNCNIRTELRVLPANGGKRRIEGIATTSHVDRVGDIVVSSGATFQLPLPLLIDHDATFPIGNVVSAIVTDEAIKFTAELPEEGRFTAIDNIYNKLVAGLIRFVSIGFRSLRSSAIKTGLKFESWEWLELSCVTIPANGAAAITAVKAYPVPSRTVPAAAPGAHLRSASPALAGRGHPMSIAKKIEAQEKRLGELRDQMADLAEQTDEDITDEQRTQVEGLSDEITTGERNLASLRLMEKAMASRAANDSDDDEPPAPREVRVEPPIRPKHKADLVFKAGVCNVIANATKAPLERVIEARYPGHHQLQQYMRATVAAPATTAQAGWAAELVQTQVAELLELLLPVSVFGRLNGLGLALTFAQGIGAITVPSRLSTPNLAGDFVGEGQPIRVAQGGLTSVKLTPHKMAVISTFTRELARQSNPQIEQVIREGILQDTALALDTRLLDNVAGNLIRPAGLANGVVPIASAGTTAENIQTDLRAALDPILALNGGRRLVWLLHPSRLIGLQSVQAAAGTFVYRDEIQNGRLFGYEYVVSTNVPSDELWLIDVADFASANGVVEWEVSDTATLHMEQDQADVKPIVGGTAAAPVPAVPSRSLFQTATIGIRFIHDVSWVMRRPGMISIIDGVAW